MEYSKHIEQIIVASSSLLAFLIVSAAIVKVLQIVSDNRLKRLLIQNGTPDHLPEFMSSKHLAQQHTLSNLKWSILLIFLSIGLISSPILTSANFQSPVFYGYLSFYMGLGLALYYILAKKILSGQKSPSSSKITPKDYD